MKLRILSIAIAIAAAFTASAASADSITKRPFRFGSKSDIPAEINEKVIVKGDTVDLIIPERTFGRYDRGLYNYLFMPKGQWHFGLTASYGEFDADDVEVLRVLRDFDFGGKQYAIRPMIGYLFRNNQEIGLKFEYNRGEANINRLAMDIIDDINFDIRDVSYYSSKYSLGIYYRNYIGLGRSKRFGLFNEVALSFGSGSSRFKRYYDEGKDLRDTRTNLTEGSLTFSPGVSVFVMENVSFNVSFGVFGVHVTHEKQRTNGENEGSRTSSGANFKFNIFNINFGLGVHI